jgi:putative glycosyltransferase (TIGR04372 family)
VNLKSKLPTKLQKYASLGVIPKLLLLPFALSFIALILLLRPFVVIKFFKVNPWRIGHLLAEVEIVRLNALEASKTKKHFVIYYFPERRAANEYVVHMWKRVLPTVSGSWGWLTFTVSFEISRKNLICEPSHVDQRSLWSSYETNLRFTNNEIEQGEKFLASINCRDHNYVCLIVRDSCYLRAIRKDKSFAFHDFRDAEINSYLQATERLTSLGYTVIRMGQIVKSPLVSENPKVIDYATNGMRSELLDIYLGANCRFCISTGTGWDVIPTVFRRPVMYSNLLPIFAPSALSFPTIIFPKSLYINKTESHLKLDEIIKRDVISTETSRGYQEVKVEIRDLSSEELVEAVTEMAQRVEGTFVETPEQKEMQAKLKHILSTHPKLQPSPNYYPIRAQFASCFLSRYPNFLDGLD